MAASPDMDLDVKALSLPSVVVLVCRLRALRAALPPALHAIV